MKPSPNLLLVEGATEKRVIPELLELRGIEWEPTPKNYAVTIKDYGGFENMVAPDELETASKSSGLKALGMIFDCDGLHDTSNRLAKMQARCQSLGINIPNPLPENGFIATLTPEIKFGVWMMPNNIDSGMLETFLMNLVPDPNSELYQFAIECAAAAKTKGAPYKDCHNHKSIIHTFLAWLDSPGPQLHEAVKFRMLDANAKYADNFTAWFRALYDL
jgi:hypothetical protein